ncbi:MAG: cupin domain-containing protein [Clostridia bacterium]|nr:cupin domain-containing protein [Clostridia bacterium]
MNIILLSGGSGKRLWPLSNEIRSKQFVKFLRNKNGEYESMIQRVYNQIKIVDPLANIVIATSKTQQSVINSQLSDEVCLSIEPCRKDTFPAIVLASAYLVDVLEKSVEEAVVFCPVDPYVDDSFFESIEDLYNHILLCDSNISLIGIEPTYPSEKYGYIIANDAGRISRVLEFKEKPTYDKAVEYVNLGALWNGGVFGFKLKYILKKAKDILGINKYQDLLNNYENLSKISFDYAVVEKEKNIDVLRYNGLWKDIGTWNSLTEVMSENVFGKGKLDDTCKNVHIINELDIPIVGIGLKNIVISASPDGILVTDKNKSDSLKMYVEKIEQRPMYEERFWGNYKVLDYNINNDNQNSLTKHLVICPGKFISYQKHKHRSELWTIIEGTGVVIINGKKKNVSRGDFIHIKPNDLHSIKAISELHIIEVQIGDELVEEDIERFEWNWD